MTENLESEFDKDFLKPFINYDTHEIKISKYYWKELNENYLNDGEFNTSQTKVNEHLILDTDNKTNPLNFTMVIEEENIYYEAIVNFSNVEEYILKYNGGRACLRVKWFVADESSDKVTSGEFVSYHAIKKSDFDMNKYVGVVKLNGKIYNNEQIEYGMYFGSIYYQGKDGNTTDEVVETASLVTKCFHCHPPYPSNPTSSFLHVPIKFNVFSKPNPSGSPPN